jgi:hypothetical protein
MVFVVVGTFCGHELSQSSCKDGRKAPELEFLLPIIHQHGTREMAFLIPIGIYIDALPWAKN